MKTLFRTFLAQFFTSETVDSDVQLRHAIAGVLAFVITPCLLLFPRGFGPYQPVAYRPSMQVPAAVIIRLNAVRAAAFEDAIEAAVGLLIAYSMITIGLVAAYAWDALTFDRRDAMVLGPLPVRGSTIMAAKIGALGVLLVGASLGIGALNSLLFALGTADRAGWRVFVVNFFACLVVTTCAAIVAFCVVVTARTFVVMLGGPRLAGRLGAVFQFLLVVAILELFVTAFASSHSEGRLAVAQMATPTLTWFVAWFDVLRGAPRGQWPEVVELGRRAAALVLTAVCGAFATSVLTFRLQMRRALAPVGRPGRVGRATISRTIARALCCGDRRACAAADFTLTTIAASRPQQTPIAMNAAVGVALILVGVTRHGGFSRTDAVTAPLMFAFWAIIGLRAAFFIPSELASAWTFQVNAPGRFDSYARGVRAAIVALVAPAVGAIAGAVGGWTHATRTVLLVVALADVVVLTIDFVPFTRAYRPGHARLKTRWPIYAIGAYAFAYGCLRIPVVLLLIPVAALELTIGGRSLRRWTLGNSPRDMADDTAVILDLMGTSAVDADVAYPPIGQEPPPARPFHLPGRVLVMANDFMPKFLRRLVHLLRQRRFDADLAEEMAFHREMSERDLRRAGAAPADARREAQRLFGSSALAHDRARDVWIPPAVRDVTRDVRFAVRLLAKDRWFSLAAVLTLALGIGAAGTIFTIFDGMFLKGLPVEQPDRIVTVRAIDRRGRPLQFSPAQYADWSTASQTLHAVAGYAGATANLTDPGLAPERIPASYVSASLFAVLGERPHLGRVFTADDDRAGAPPVIILGEGVWKRRYGSDPDIVGRSIAVNGSAVTVVGIMPARFRFPLIDEAWLPLAAAPRAQDRERDARTISIVARLADGATIPQARTELDAIAARLATQYPETDADLRASIQPYTGGFTGFNNPWSDALLAASFLLLIGCANVGSLLLARSAGRTRDLAIRTALGATRWRVLRQLLVESAVLSVLAGGIGLALTWLGVRVWMASLPATNWPYWFRWDFDARVLMFLLIASTATAFLAGLAPAVLLSRTTAAELMQRRAPTRRTRRWTSVLIAIELALTIVLLTGAGLMVRTTTALLQIDSLVDTPHVLMANVSLPAARYATAGQRSRFMDALTVRLGAVPGVRSATVANAMPFFTAPLRVLEIVGEPDGAWRQRPAVSYVTIGSQYFDTLGVRVVLGRDFSPADGTVGHPAAIVNQRFVDMFFGGRSPLGATITLTDPNATHGEPPRLEIVGVSPTIRQHYAQDLDPVVYAPYRQDPTAVPLVLARTTGDPDAASMPMRDVVKDLDPTLVLFNIMPLEQLLAGTGFANRVFLTFFTVFAGLALLLSAIGLYAATRHTITERRQEIGLRVALGAQPRDVVWLFTRRMLVVLACGGAAGLAGAVACARLMRGFLVQTSPSDPATLASTTLLLAAVAILATVLPARRALRVDPAVTLRCE